MYLGPCPNGRALWKTEYVIHIYGPHPYQSYYVHAERKKEWGERERESEKERVLLEEIWKTGVYCNRSISVDVDSVENHMQKMQLKAELAQRNRKTVTALGTGERALLICFIKEVEGNEC